jgi:hypothetical protein
VVKSATIASATGLNLRNIIRFITFILYSLFIREHPIAWGFAASLS